jgi:parvulin-like peptidyl-prolyl isomerase
VGDIADKPVKTDKGFHVVKMTNKRPKLDRSFDSVKRMIESRLLRTKRKEALDKFVEELRGKADVEIFEDNLKKVEVPSGGPLMGPYANAPGPRPTGAPVPPKTQPKTPSKPEEQ